MAARRFRLMVNEVHACNGCFQPISGPKHAWKDDDLEEGLIFCSPGCVIGYKQAHRENPDRRITMRSSNEDGHGATSPEVRRRMSFGEIRTQPAPLRDDPMSENALNAPIEWEEFPWEQADELTQSNSAFENFRDLVEALGGYRPSIDVSDLRRRRLADLYDYYQEMMGDSRRAYRYRRERA